MAPGPRFPVNGEGSDGRCNTIWYKAVFKGGVYETRETVWVFGGAVASSGGFAYGRTMCACLAARHLLPVRLS